MTDAELIDKFHTLADPVLGERRSAAIIPAVRQLTDADADLDQLLECILTPPLARNAAENTSALGRWSRPRPRRSSPTPAARAGWGACPWGGAVAL